MYRIFERFAAIESEKRAIAHAAGAGQVILPPVLLALPAG
jgi:hypothetical protein